MDPSPATGFAFYSSYIVVFSPAEEKPWPEWLCPSGDLVSPLRPLDDVSFRQADDVPCLSDGSQEKELAVAAKEETQEEKEKHDDEDDEKEKHDDDDDDDEETHKKAAVSAKLAQGEEEARAQAAVAA